MNLTALLAIVGLGVVGFFGGKGGIKLGNRVEDRRRTAVRLATWCGSNGLPDLGVLLTEYAVQNYGGVLQQFTTMADLVADPARAQKAIDEFMDVQLQKKLATQEGRDWLIAVTNASQNIAIDPEALVQPPVVLKKEG